MQEEQSATAKLIAYFPALTGTALLVLSVFNIGYFSKIGFHFLGVMDFSNFVYSLSFIVAILVGSLSVSLWGDYLEALFKNIGDASGRKKIWWTIGVFLSVSTITVVGLAYLFPSALSGHFPTDRVVAVPFVVGAAVLAAHEYSASRQSRKLKFGNAFQTAVLITLAIYYVGRAVAEHEIYFVRTTYSVSLKDLAVP